MLEAQAREKIRVLSETALYPQAQQFFTPELGLLNNSQASGLENTARNASSLREVEDFLKRQSQKDSKHSQLYLRLIEEVGSLKKALKEEGIVPNGLTKNEEKGLMDRYGIVLLREYLFHLLSENAYKRTVIGRGEE